jgi:hypothetical protein
MPESNRLPPPDRPVQADSSPRRRGHSATAVAAEPAAPSRPGTAVDTPRDTTPGWPGGTRRTARRQRTGCDLLGALAIASVVVVLALWAYNQGIQSLSLGLAGSDSFGRLAGLLASDLMLLQVLLMARIPWVERAWGHDVLARRHRLLGMASFWFMMAHVVLITVEYAQHDGLSILAQLWQFQFDQRGVLVATVGTVLLIMVVGLSIRAARRRLRYESWHLLHLYTYLGMGLALPHQVFAGSEFNNSLPARIYWWTLSGGGACLPPRAARLALGVPPTPGSRRGTRGAGCGVGADQGPPARPAARTCRAVLPLAIPGRPWVDPGQPVLAVRATES